MAGGTDQSIDLFAASTGRDALQLSDRSGKVTYRREGGESPPATACACSCPSYLHNVGVSSPTTACPQVGVPNASPSEGI